MKEIKEVRNEGKKRANVERKGWRKNEMKKEKNEQNANENKYQKKEIMKEQNEGKCLLKENVAFKIKNWLVCFLFCFTVYQPFSNHLMLN